MERQQRISEWQQKKDIEREKMLLEKRQRREILN
jgi:hypothetical protein